MTNLPQGWEVKKLEEVCKNSSSNLALKDIKDKNGQYPVFGASGIVGYVDFYHKDKECLGIVKDGAGVGRVFVLPKNTSVIGTLNYLEALENTNLKYLFYFLCSVDFSKYILGSAIPHIYFRDYKKEQIPLPPLQEQERIVGILDESFAKIDESIKILEQDLLNLDELMQSALQKAFNLLKDNAKENYKLPQGWEWKSLGEICEIIGGGTPSKQIKQYWENGTIKWATVRDMNTETIEDTEFRITNLGLDNSSTNIINQDFILIATRVGLGKVCLVKDTLAINQDLKGILPHKSLNKKYLFYFFKKNKDFLIENGIGATVKGVSVDFIKSLQISLPPLKEQEQIASHLDELSSHVKNLKQNYQMQIKNLQELKKSLLDKAFQGRL
ncbi:TPA: restriction endonuclease subunit S [Campylobacter lari]|nr:restriction endonuclease subunit S [Campylobacter lari]